MPPSPRPAAAGERRIHPGAWVDPRAEIARGVTIGPGSVVGPRVRLGANVWLGAHAVLTGDVEVGAEARLFHGAVVGEVPQDRAFRDEPSRVRIGPRTQVREHVTIHRATGSGEETTIGADALLMAGSHVGHNCRLGDRVVLGGGTLLAGHVRIASDALLSGNVVVHQFARIGRLTMIGGGSRVARDVPPFMLLVGDSRVRSLNGVDLRRNGFDRETQLELRRLFRVLYLEGHLLSEAIELVAAEARTAAGRELAAFLEDLSPRGLSSK